MMPEEKLQEKIKKGKHRIQEVISKASALYPNFILGSMNK